LSETTTPRIDPLVGTTLDNRFEIVEVLGTGGAGVVYKARQLRVNRFVAIKTIRLEIDVSEVIRERFQREINSLCALNHPNVVTVYDCIFGDDDQPYIVMDYLQGLSLDALLRNEGAFDLDKFARIALQVLSAVDHAHRKGIIHRDLKPGNIVLQDEETDIVKVVDFGLAKLAHDRSLTKTGELWGSPPYMAPEQAQGEPVDMRSDIYALGAVFYEMLTGKDPFFEVATVYELIQAHIGQDPPSFEHSNPNHVAPPAVQAVIFKALKKNPDERYQSAIDMQTALVEALSAQLEGESRDYLLRFSTRAISREPAISATRLDPVQNGTTADRDGEDAKLPNSSLLDRSNVPTMKMNAGGMASRFQQSANQRDRALLWIPWSIAGCSFLLALSLGVIVLKFLSRETVLPELTSPPNPSAQSPGSGSVPNAQASIAAPGPSKPETSKPLQATASNVSAPVAKEQTKTVRVHAPAISVVQAKSAKPIARRKPHATVTHARNTSPARQSAKRDPWAELESNR
jgi:serine/threonine protein kinase